MGRFERTTGPHHFQRRNSIADFAFLRFLSQHRGARVEYETLAIEAIHHHEYRIQRWNWAIPLRL